MDFAINSQSVLEYHGLRSNPRVFEVRRWEQFAKMQISVENHSSERETPLRFLMDRHLFVGEIQQPNSSDGVAGKMALQRSVIDGVVECGHDHGLIEYQAAVAYRASNCTDGVIEASVGVVDVGIQGPQVDDV